LVILKCSNLISKNLIWNLWQKRTAYSTYLYCVISTLYSKNEFF
jgi:hypothetical protein